MTIATTIYFSISLVWMIVFLKRNAFDKKSFLEWLGAIGAVSVWPISFGFIVQQLWKQKRCEKCKVMLANHKMFGHRVYGSKHWK